MFTKTSIYMLISAQLLLWCTPPNFEGAESISGLCGSRLQDGIGFCILGGVQERGRMGTPSVDENFCFCMEFSALKRKTKRETTENCKQEVHGVNVFPPSRISELTDSAWSLFGLPASVSCAHLLQAAALFSLPAGGGYCLYYAYASVWLEVRGGCCPPSFEGPFCK